MTIRQAEKIIGNGLLTKRPIIKKDKTMTQVVLNRTKDKRIDSIEKKSIPINKETKKPNIEPLKTPCVLTDIYLEVSQDKGVDLDILNSVIEKILSNKIDMSKVNARYIRTAYKKTKFNSFRRSNHEQKIFDCFDLDKHSNIIGQNYELSNFWIIQTVLKKLKQHKAKSLFCMFYVFGLTQKQIAIKLNVSQPTIHKRLNHLNYRIANFKIQRLIESRFVLSENGKQKIRMKQNYDDILKADGLTKQKNQAWAGTCNMIDIESYPGVKTKQLEKNEYDKWIDMSAYRSNDLKTALRQSSGFVSDNLTQPVPLIDIPVIAVTQRPIVTHVNMSSQDSTQYHYNKDGDIVRLTRELTANTIKYVNRIDNEIKFKGRMRPNMAKARRAWNQKIINEIMLD